MVEHSVAERQFRRAVLSVAAAPQLAGVEQAAGPHHHVAPHTLGRGGGAVEGVVPGDAGRGVPEGGEVTPVVGHTAAAEVALPHGAGGGVPLAAHHLTGVVHTADGRGVLAGEAAGGPAAVELLGVGDVAGAVGLQTTTCQPVEQYCCWRVRIDSESV